MIASQRKEPGDPRAKAIEAIARGHCAAHWERLPESVRDFYRTAAECALAALEAEGWCLTSTREADDEWQYTDEACKPPDTREAEKPCKTCGGSRAFTDTVAPCPSCGGSGHARGEHPRGEHATKGTGR